MEINDINFYMQQFGNKIPADKNLILRTSLQKASQEELTNLSMVQLYEPTTTLLLSLFLGGFGVDRFYIGDTGLGITKLLFGWLTLGIWPLIDIFSTYKKAKEKNFNKIMSLLC